jgi:hypothetical protein
MERLASDPKVAQEYWKLPSTQYILDLLGEVIEEDLDIAVKSSEKEDRYDKACWTQWLADNVGYRRALRKIKQLIEVDKK